MARYAYERLSAQDLSFLVAERDATPMHVGALAILETGPLRSESGGVNIEAYRCAVESVLHWIPRYRQRLAWTPLEGWAVWVDDRHFDLGYHIRHISVPRPGTLEQLKALAGRILARRLDRARPLWEIWVIEGLEDGDQFALLNKVHHCMLDGAAGAELSQILFSPTASVETGPPVSYLPRPEPSRLELLGHEVLHRAAQPARVLRAAAEWLSAEDADPVGDVARRAAALGELASWSLQPASETPINGEVGPNRVFDWLTMPLDDVRELRRVLGCTINDIVLATVAGALRRYLFRRRVDPASLDFRISAPVNVRREEDGQKLGNHVSAWILRMPLGEVDPLKQLSAIGERTEELKRSHAAAGLEAVMAAAEWLAPDLLSMGMALAQGPMNMVVTNVPGPQFPLFSVGARLLGLYPVVPLIPGGGLGIALFSYEGKLCWGFNADPELVPDIQAFAGDVGESFELLRNATVARFLDSRTLPPEAEEKARPKLDRKPKRAAKPRSSRPSSARSSRRTGRSGKGTRRRSRSASVESH